MDTQLAGGACPPKEDGPKQALFGHKEYENMDAGEIDALFEKVASEAAYADEGVRQVFKSLVKTTLAYRDHLKQSQAIVLTVYDVRVVLDRLVDFIQSGKVPKTDNMIQTGLFRRLIAALTENGVES